MFKKCNLQLTHSLELISEKRQYDKPRGVLFQYVCQTNN